MSIKFSKAKSASAGTASRAARRRFSIGDKVKVIGKAQVTYPPGMKDELGTEKLFDYMTGRIYTVRGFDKYGHVELHPDRNNWVWIERKYLKLQAKKKDKQH